MINIIMINKWKINFERFTLFKTWTF